MTDRRLETSLWPLHPSLAFGSVARARLLLFIFLPLLPGCREASDKMTVSGKVTYRGAPLSNAAVTFIPASGRPVTAPLSTEGKYSVELAPGEYTAIVNIGVELPPGYKEGQPLPPPKVVLPDIYTIPARSQLKATVSTEDQQPINFELK